MLQVTVMDMRVLDFYVSGGIREQDTLVRLRRWDVNVAKVRTPLGVEVDPELQAFYLEILQVDIALQVQRVEIFDPHGGHHAANLPELFTSLGIEEFKAKQLDRLGRNYS